MSTLIPIIGLISTLFQNIAVPASFFPRQDTTKTLVRIYAGLSSDPSKSTDGNIPGVATWDSSGAFIGKAMGVYNYVIDQGRYHDLEIKGKKMSAEYLSVSAFGKDGLCVAAVGVTSPTGYRGGWFGDVAMRCGAPWYPSNLVIPGSSPEARPACVWIDQDASNGHLNKGITIHLPSFSNAGDGLPEEYNGNVDAMCRSLPRFSMWTGRSVHMTVPVFKGGLAFNEDGSDGDVEGVVNPDMMESETTAPNDPTGTVLGVADGASASVQGDVVVVAPSRRRVRRGSLNERSSAGMRYQPLADRLVISNVTSHSAKEVCESLTSAGPDFVSVSEGLFCDMHGKILWPVCVGGVDGSCFDLEERAMRWVELGDGVNVAKPELRVRGEIEARVYRDVQSWK